MFRNNSLALDMNIGIGDVVVRHEDGHRSYELRGKEREIDIEGKTIDEVLEDVVSQDDYFEHESIASEYNIWYQRVHEFLESNPEICRKIEEEAGVEGLSEFFRMADR